MAVKKHFKDVDTRVSFPELEAETIKYWKKNKIFEKSIENRPANKEWTFLDGPPFVTGMPHYGSLLSSLPKDVFGRYWTMKGYRVRRVWGWDGHGLPIENKVENKLNITRKKDIEEKVGVDKFIEECKEYVSEVSSEWEWYVDRIGRWVDFKNAYKTWDKDYMESVMWVFHELYEGGWVYKGLRVSLYCPHCATPISNFEVAMDADNYKDLTEPANTYKYKLVGEDKTYFLAWSTTPWNKLATPALAVNPKLTYVKVKQNEEFYILAKSTLKILTDDKYEIVEEYKGEDLVGKEFEAHYDFFKIDEGKRAFVIIPGDFVTSEEGTGIVTIAAYGEDDLKAMNENNIQIVLHVDEEGHLTDDVPRWAGMYYLKVNKLVNEDLEKRGLMYREDQHHHSVPTCWRCHTRLIYAPQDAWFVDIQKLKKDLKKNNEFVNWHPNHFKHGRFQKSIEAAPDWCISRSRYWGSPVPVWETESGKRIVPKSIKHLEELSGQKVSDLHKPEIDNITIKHPETGEIARRVPEVLDSWIEAGSASFAERHYPMEKHELENFYPPDFISEYTGQIRAWFYVLHVIASALKLRNEEDKNKLAENVLVTGVIKGSDGRKMSKNFGNYPDPKEMITKHGGDALRLYLLGSSVMHGEDVLISEEEYKNQVKGFLLPLWNVYNYFVTYANNSHWQPGKKSDTSTLDKWVISKLNTFINEISKDLDKYDTPAAIEKARKFIVDDVSGWYVRRSRGREDNAFFETLHEVLSTFSKTISPLAPFISENIYMNLNNDKSVHLENWPTKNDKLVNSELETSMNTVREIVQITHSKRKEANIPVRQPLAKMTVSTQELGSDLEKLILDEVNVKNIEWSDTKQDKIEVTLDTNLTEDLIEEAKSRDLIRKIQSERKQMGLNPSDKVIVKSDWLPKDKELISWISEKTGATSLKSGDFSVKIDE